MSGEPGLRGCPLVPHPELRPVPQRQAWVWAVQSPISAFASSPAWAQHGPVPALQHGVTLVPAEEFSAEFVEPRVRCVSSHGTFGPGR